MKTLNDRQCAEQAILHKERGNFFEAMRWFNRAAYMCITEEVSLRYVDAAMRMADCGELEYDKLDIAANGECGWHLRLA